ncbi:hypothetical protein [Chryseobacterium sp. PMSZPI]|uniref:hypothetical protein n=1 Tax=Chryseobacterium sp. PMSZPI TaxID=1033900 RepID=UPI000C327987|nr:hypothetical protein [Chryseobacterium sp. PMSZPI]PKF75334.1 hypothetical protein CW752_05115 [Chryseobacterium sp. PMSZPI]
MKKYIKIIFLLVSIVVLSSVFILYRYYYIDTLIENSILDFSSKKYNGKPIRIINSRINDTEPIPSDTIIGLYEYDVTKIKEIFLKKYPKMSIEIPRNTIDNIKFMRETDMNKMDIYCIFISKKKRRIDFYMKEFLIQQSYTSKKNEYLYEIKNIKKFVWKNFQWYLADNKTEEIKYYQNGFIEIKHD